MTNKSFTYRFIGRSFKLLPGLLLGCLLLLSAQAFAEAQNKAVVLVFGDSLSAAYRMPEELGWVALLQDRLTSKDLPWRVVNGSVSGETTGGGLARLPAFLEAHSPQVVILELGGNDGLRGLPVSSIHHNLAQMITLSQTAGARVLLTGMQIPPNYGPRYTEPFHNQYQELAERFDIALIPFLLEGIAEDSSLMQDDGIHPVAAAQPKILEIVWPALKELL